MDSSEDDHYHPRRLYRCCRTCGTSSIAYAGLPLSLWWSEMAQVAHLMSYTVLPVRSRQDWGCPLMDTSDNSAGRRQRCGCRSRRAVMRSLVAAALRSARGGILYYAGGALSTAVRFPTRRCAAA